MRFYCKKQNKIINNYVKDCNKCFEENKAGFNDKLLCQNFNLDLIEESTNEF